MRKDQSKLHSASGNARLLCWEGFTHPGLPLQPVWKPGQNKNDDNWVVKKTLHRPDQAYNTLGVCLQWLASYCLHTSTVRLSTMVFILALLPCDRGLNMVKWDRIIRNIFYADWMYPGISWEISSNFVESLPNAVVSPRWRKSLDLGVWPWQKMNRCLVIPDKPGTIAFARFLRWVALTESLCHTICEPISA